MYTYIYIYILYIYIYIYIFIYFSKQYLGKQYLEFEDNEKEVRLHDVDLKNRNLLELVIDPELRGEPHGYLTAALDVALLPLD